MKTQNLLFYVLKWIALIFLAYLIIQDSFSKVLALFLIGFVSVLLIWEGFRDFRTKSNK